MKRREFLTSSVAAGAAVASLTSAASAAATSPQPSTSGKPPGRLGRSYRIIWDYNHGEESFYNPPMEPEKIAQAHFGHFEGTPVDAIMVPLGPDCGYTVSYPTKVKGVDFILDRYNRGAKLGGVNFWRHAENLKHIWEMGRDPFQIQVDEAERLGIDLWFRLSMNDWHHADTEGNVVRLIGSQFFIDHPEFRLGEAGTKGAPAGLANSIKQFQDYAYPEVRQLRMDLMTESCERYDARGFEYDFMRCPAYFKYGQEEQHVPVMTEFVRESRRILDEIGKKKGRQLGLSVRVPNTIDGARRLGLDVPTWIREELVDLVVPSTFFNADLEENITEWAELARNTPVRINPAFEEGYNAGHTGGVTRCFYNPSIMLPVTTEMINGIAARHWRNGADGMYLFNWFGTAPTYDYDNSSALDDIGDPLRLKYKNKRYVVMRRDNSFPNCLPVERQLPTRIDKKTTPISIDVADDLKEAGTRVKRVQLHAHLNNLTVVDELEARLNGQVLECTNPMQPGGYDPRSSSWQNFEIPPDTVRHGKNEVALRMVKQNDRIVKELPIELADLELFIEYEYPNGPWLSPPGYVPRT